MRAFRNRLVLYVTTTVAVTLLIPASSLACACGCNVFSVGARWMMATSTGLRMLLTHDYMDQADPANTGYDRLYLSPSLEVNVSQNIQLYGDVRIPLLTHVTGYPLVAPALFEVTVGYQL